jgi:hypothetical protein
MGAARWTSFFPSIPSPSQLPYASLGPRGSLPRRALPEFAPASLEIPATAASAGHHRRAASPAASAPKSRHPWAPKRPSGPPRPLPRPAPPPARPEFGRSRAGRPPKGRIAKPRIFSRAFVRKVNSNSEVNSLFLVNFVENRRKSDKCKTNFAGFVVKYPTTFVILAWANSC